MTTTNVQLATADVIEAATQCAIAKHNGAASVLGIMDTKAIGGVIMKGYSDMITVFFHDGTYSIVSRNVDGRYQVEMSGPAHPSALARVAQMA